MVLREAQRAYTYLQVYGYPVDAVLVNRILPKTMAGTLFGGYLETQQAYLREIEESFAPLPVFHAPHMGREVYGLGLLEQIGATLYHDQDPAQLFYNQPTYLLEEDGADKYLLKIRLPFLSRSEVELRHHGDELTLLAKNRQRIVFLPKFLTYYRLKDYSIEDGWLHIHFNASGNAKE
jgi:arsenite-transporting ATPase